MVAMSAGSEIKCKDATEGCGSDELQERVRRVWIDLEEAETRYGRSILYEISKKINTNTYFKRRESDHALIRASTLHQNLSMELTQAKIR